jgi:hypothetical protein
VRREPNAPHVARLLHSSVCPLHSVTGDLKAIHSPPTANLAVPSPHLPTSTSLSPRLTFPLPYKSFFLRSQSKGRAAREQHQAHCLPNVFRAVAACCCTHAMRRITTSDISEQIAARFICMVLVAFYCLIKTALFAMHSQKNIFSMEEFVEVLQPSHSRKKIFIVRFVLNGAGVTDGLAHLGARH